MAPLKIVSSQDALRRVQRPAVTAAAKPNPEVVQDACHSVQRPVVEPNPADFQLHATQAWTRAASME